MYMRLGSKNKNKTHTHFDRYPKKFVEKNGCRAKGKIKVRKQEDLLPSFSPLPLVLVPNVFV